MQRNPAGGRFPDWFHLLFLYESNTSLLARFTFYEKLNGFHHFFLGCLNVLPCQGNDAMLRLIRQAKQEL